MSTGNDLVGRWFSIDGDSGIVRYHGAVSGTKGVWLGVEWATPNRGKHSGTHSGHQYFQCQKGSGPHGSFIRQVDRMIWGQPLLQAAKQRYIVDDLAELNTLPQAIDGRRGKIEAVGLDKIAMEQSDLRSLSVLGLDSLRIDGVDGDTEETKWELANVRTLSLANNYFTQWDRLLGILRTVPLVEILDISANHFESPVRVTKERFTVDTLRVDSSDALTWLDIVNVAQQLNVRSLSFGWSQVAAVLDTPVEWYLEELHLESNEIKDISPLAHLPCLRLLNVRGNPISNITLDFSTVCFPQLHTLNLSHTLLAQWSAVDSLLGVASLRTLAIVSTPLTAKDMAPQIIARLPQITKLDGSMITSDERTEMERYYLALCSRSTTTTTTAGAQETGSLLVDRMAAEFPRIHELVAKHGMPPPPAVERESRLKSRLASVTLMVVRSGGKDVVASESRSLIRTMLVRQIRPIAVKLAKCRGFRLEVSNDKIEEDHRHWVALDNDTRPLSYYGVEDGSVIRVLVD
ncbi:hypothetical protein BX661DRAFT_176256 [Kickxella alabastrina]|uniref:uncharacterized protein n=1 Tax=Kickxella alabastrina TaxID=61397 RepID=UPI002220C7D6|nr:uncharacterized protein BX661DRAFT_176256 [Kickxella alabastrina]KAI7835180.1 hypothetical protein BX661DRAFT_176256 [Kickxella alabastrina]KAJ1947582.1 hypothetical protein GGF37_000347 [Kickxella alabastrina]